MFIERLWRSLKYEAVYLHDLADGFEAERAIAGWMRFYNGSRPHLSLAGRTPAEAYGGGAGGMSHPSMMDAAGGADQPPPARRTPRRIFRTPVAPLPTPGKSGQPAPVGPPLSRSTTGAKPEAERSCEHGRRLREACRTRLRSALTACPANRKNARVRGTQQHQEYT